MTVKVDFIDNVVLPEELFVAVETSCHVTVMAAAADSYVCQLDARSAEKAKKELNEDAKDRLNAVNALRTWIQQQPHITYETGQSVINILSLSLLQRASYLQAVSSRCM